MSRHTHFMHVDPLVIAGPLLNGITYTSPSIGVQGYNNLTLYCDLDYTAANPVLITMQVQYEASTAWHSTTSVSVVAGTGTRVTYIDSTATGADKSWVVPFFVPEGVRAARIQYAGTNGVAADAITIFACLSNTVS